MFDKIFYPLYVWFYVGGFKIIIVVLGGVVLNSVIKKFSTKFIKTILIHAEIIAGEGGKIEDGRLRTVSHIFNSTTKVVIVLIASVMILSELGFNIAPIITGAGIVGLAFGFGSQSLVKDFVSGLFILVENQYNVGDNVNLGNISGTKVQGKVEKMNLRRTVIKDNDGSIHIIPNGSILIVTKLGEENK